MTMNPVSALTGADSDAILDDPLVHAFMLRAWPRRRRSASASAARSPSRGEERMGLARKLGSFKTSMLQDALAGRPIELDALVTRGARDRRAASAWRRRTSAPCSA